MDSQVIHYLQFDDVDSELMKKLLDFMYLQEVADLKKSALKLLLAAAKYKIVNQIKLCVKRLAYKLSKKNVVDIFILAEKLDVKALLTNCT